MKRGLSAVMLVGLVSFGANAQDVELSSDLQKFSYHIGLQIGRQMKEQGLEMVDTQALAAAIKDQITGTEPRVSEEDRRAALGAMQKIMMASREGKASKSLEMGQAFLAENGSKEGIKTLDSGLQYRVHNEGEGTQPTAASKVKVHYTGKLLNGTVFDSSYERGEPAEFGVGQVIPGWQEILTHMKPGAKFEVWIPSELGYGARGAGGSIGPNETLHFLIELIEIVSG